jgi:hypothetical protein
MREMKPAIDNKVMTLTNSKWINLNLKTII